LHTRLRDDSILRAITVGTATLWYSVTVVARVVFYTCGCERTVTIVASMIDLCTCDCKTMMT